MELGGNNLNHTTMKKILLALSMLPMVIGCQGEPNATKQLANTILEDSTLLYVKDLAHEVIAQGLNAGTGYSQVWARDMNTFVEVSVDVTDPVMLRNAILLFFAMQQISGEMVDGYVVKDDFTWYDDTPYYSVNAPNHVGFKNTVETDQESSLIQLLGKYILKSGDKSILKEQVGGKSLYERIDDMIDYLLRERYDAKHGLLYGAMTSDWGDVQPGDCFVCDYNECSFPAIDIYDNAMFIIALDYLIATAEPQEERLAKWQDLRAEFAENSRKHLWDDTHKKFIPHIYLEGSPMPEGFDENTIHYHGGTAVAIEAGLLSSDEIKIVTDQMIANVKESGMPTIGLTLYPVYPEGVFSGDMSNPFHYQNGGDWTWFGGRMIQQLVKNGFVEEAYEQVRPMIDRVVANEDFNEWYGLGNKPLGSKRFKGSAGVLAKSVDMLREWASENR